MALQGNLEAFPLPEVIRLLARSQQTGVLVIETDAGETRAYLEDVNPIYMPISSDEDFTPSVSAVVVITPLFALMYCAFIGITAFIISSISWELMKRARRRRSLERRDFITL